MNVFENLVIELKEENLLENTVIELDRNNADDDNGPIADRFQSGSFDPPLAEKGEEFSEFNSINVQGSDEHEVPDIANGSAVSETKGEQFPVTKPQKVGKEFFKKRAVAEVSSLQMVEHVLTGVEREFMKVVPKSFDDFNAKKALHTLLNITQDSNSEEHKGAELALMHETETWCMALTDRDCHVSVSNLRRYCENSRPALSSQALLALARFYRNSPCSESVRAKFDFVITRLFSRPADNDKRVCLFNREETVGHISTLYNEWSSIPLYTADDDESNVLLTGLSFDDLAAEAEAAVNFDQLISSDFFGRIRLFKESISELFFAPTVTSAAIESNIRIGNAYVELINSERSKMDASSIQTKYGDIDGQSVSDVTGRTLDLSELLRQPLAKNTSGARKMTESTEREVETRHYPIVEAQPTIEPSKERSVFVSRLIDSARKTNKVLLAIAVIALALSAILYIWADFFAAEKISSAGVNPVSLENSVLAEYATTARVSGENFYGLLSPAWDALPKEKRLELLKKVLDEGRDRGYAQVILINKEGKQAGFASASRVEVVMP